VGTTHHLLELDSSYELLCGNKLSFDLFIVGFQRHDFSEVSNGGMVFKNLKITSCASVSFGCYLVARGPEDRTKTDR